MKQGRKGLEGHEPLVTFVAAVPLAEANAIIGLNDQGDQLPARQHIRQLEQAFLKEGGLRERMTRARLAARAGNDVQ